MEESPERKTKLRFDFIGMAFALVVGEIGLVVVNNFAEDRSIFDHPHIFTQVLLSLIVVSTSWVGWQSSTSQGNLETIKSVFSRPFLILLVDLFLVICYFLLIRTTESIEEGKEVLASSYEETRWIMIIFAGYIIWDFLTKFTVPENQESSDKKKIAIQWNNFWRRAYPSVVCFILAFLTFMRFAYRTEWQYVVINNLLLIAFFILFRILKDEHIKRKNLWSVIITIVILILGIGYYTQFD